MRSELTGGCHAVLSWEVPETHAYPIFEIGVEIETRDPLGVDGTLYLDYLTWGGAPDTVLKRPDNNLSTMWKHAWVNNVSQFQTRWEGLRVTNGDGLGFIAQGTRDWKDYRVTSEIMPLLANAWGLAARVQGRERYYALMFDRAEGGRVRLVKRVHDEFVLASERFDWQLDRRYRIELRVAGTDIEAHVDGKNSSAFRHGRSPIDQRRRRARRRQRIDLRGGGARVAGLTGLTPPRSSSRNQAASKSRRRSRAGHGRSGCPSAHQTCLPAPSR